MAPQQIAVLSEKQRNEEYENAYGKSQLEGLNYQNIHRRIKSRSEAYQDGQNQPSIAVNMKAPQNSMYLENNQQQHLIQRKKDSTQDLENFHVFHNIILQERAVGQKQAASSVQKPHGANEQNQQKSSKMGQSLHFTQQEGQTG